MYAGSAVDSPRGTISAEILVHGVPTAMFARTDGRRFVVGTPGASYAIRVFNKTNSRIEVITTIDGRHVLDDEPGDYRRNRGFVIPARGTYLFRGWRSSMDGTERFVFCDPSVSVSQMATGRTDNLGVIGMAVYTERFSDPLYDAERTVAVAAAAPAVQERPRSLSVGTGMGEHVHDPVQKTSFTRGITDPDILAIGYDTREALEAMGLMRPADPNPFPATEQTGYAHHKFHKM